MTYSDITGDPIALALSYVAAATEHGEDAEAAAICGDHSRAGRDRSKQRAAMKSAEVQIALSQAVSLQRIADATERAALIR